jgi:hypothetical protein
MPFSSSPLWLNMFRLFVILSLTQLYRYTPEIFLFSTVTFKYNYRSPSDELENTNKRNILSQSGEEEKGICLVLHRLKGRIHK